MKRKRDYSDLIGDDGELLVPFSVDARKRKIYVDDGSRQQGQAVFLLGLIGLAVLMLVLGFGLWASGDSPSQVPLPTLVVLQEPTRQSTPLSQTLPATWTPAPSRTPIPSQARATHTPTGIPPTSTASPIPSHTPPTIISQTEVRGAGEWQGEQVLQAGDVVIVEYIGGDWKPWAEANWTDASGSGGYRCSDGESCGVPIPAETWNALIARIGNGQPFYVGNYSRFVAETGGVLSFRMNDTDTSDNIGSLHIQVSIRRTDE